VEHRFGLLPADVARLFDTTEEVGRKVLSAAVLRGERDLGGVRGVRKTLLQRIEAGTSAEPLRVAAREPAPDGFVKYLFELHDGARVEAVRIPVPCEAEGADLSRFEGKEKKYVVLCHPSGGCIDGRAITISTAGIVPQIRRFTAEGHKFRLAVSLTSALPSKRVRLMPIEGVHPTEELVAALHDHARARRTRVLVEYVLLGGVNDSPEDARALCRLLDPRLVKVDLIDVNPNAFGPTFERSSRAVRSAFLDVLGEAGMPFAIRYSGGQGVSAGCGQLAAGGGLPGARLQ
jgi:adenine C2-methylase RlmN of 23S rRNA A2503 and tRNA A37